MKLIIEQSNEYESVEVTIKCGQIDEGLERLIASIRLYGFSVSAKKNGKTHLLKLEDIFYFESIDEKTYVYCEKEVYECLQRLSEIERQVQHINFTRISKSCILNICKLINVRAIGNGRLEAVLENEEKVIVNRHYVKLLKEKLDI